MAGTLVTPLEIIKTRVMGGQGGRTIGQVVNRVTQVEGVQSVMNASFTISIIRTAIDKGVQVWVSEGIACLLIKFKLLLKLSYHGRIYSRPKIA